MQEAVDDFPVDDCAPADPRADGQINKVRNPSPGAPTSLAGRRCIDIGVESNRHFERPSNRSRKVDIAAIPSSALK